MWHVDCMSLNACLAVVLLYLTCVLTPSGRGIAAGRPSVGPSSGGGAGCSHVSQGIVGGISCLVL